MATEAEKAFLLTAWYEERRRLVAEAQKIVAHNAAIVSGPSDELVDGSFGKLYEPWAGTGYDAASWVDFGAASRAFVLLSQLRSRAYDSGFETADPAAAAAFQEALTDPTP